MKKGYIAGKGLDIDMAPFWKWAAAWNDVIAQKAEAVRFAKTKTEHEQALDGLLQKQGEFRGALKEWQDELDRAPRKARVYE